jgi:hypothetical protein
MANTNKVREKHSLSDTMTRSLRRLYIINTETGDTLEAQFNPDELVETFEAKWNNVTIPGLSHELLQFSNSASDKISFKLFFTGMRPAGHKTEIQGVSEVMDAIQYARRLLKAWTTPTPNAYNVLGSAPPTLVLIWPQTLSFKCIISKVEFKISNWDKSEFERGPSRAEASIEITQINDAHFTSANIATDSARWGQSSLGSYDTSGTVSVDDIGTEILDPWS